MTRKILRFLLLIELMSVFGFLPSSHAEIAQSYYATLQYVASESLTIRVHRTLVTRTKDGNDSICEVRAEVEIIGVVKSTSMLRVGNCIAIEYSTIERRNPITGPSPIPVLEVGETYPAFLAATEKKCIYTPAARGYSFYKVDAKPNLQEKHEAN